MVQKVFVNISNSSITTCRCVDTDITDQDNIVHEFIVHSKVGDLIGHDNKNYRRPLLDDQL